MSLDEKAWQAARERIGQAARAAGRDPATVRLLAVSKTQPAQAVREAWGLGPEGVRRELRAGGGGEAGCARRPGRRRVAPDRPAPEQQGRARGGRVRRGRVGRPAKIAERLSAARLASRPPLEVLVQVNISGEASKSGVAPDEAVALARSVAALPRLRLAGFMGIAEPTADVARQRAQFARLARCLSDARGVGAGRERALDGHDGGPRIGDPRGGDRGQAGDRVVRAAAGEGRAVSRSARRLALASVRAGA